jgi:hypothetical protein
MFWLFPVSVALLLAADAPWKTKAVPDWTVQDARQILTDSPWAKWVNAGLARRQSEDELRAGGNMGQPKGVGYDGVGAQKTGPNLEDLTLKTIFTKGYTPPPAEAIKVLVRWETALPIRVAELKAGEIDPPTLEGDGYKVAVYGIPGGAYKDDPTKLGDPLKALAMLRRDGKPDVKPLRVEVFQRANGLAIVYLFPLSAEISKKDAFVEFDAQIGRVVIRQLFSIPDMQLRGELEL